MNFEDEFYEVSALVRRDSAVSRAGKSLAADIEVLVSCELSAECMRKNLTKMLTEFQRCKDAAYQSYAEEQDVSAT